MYIKVKITDRRGQTHEVEVPTNMALNLMQVVQAYELEPMGTVGMCGGKLMCHTCHCYVVKDVNAPAKKEMEEGTLSRLMHLKPNSRLSCQIPITKELEGIEIAMAPLM